MKLIDNEHIYFNGNRGFFSDVSISIDEKGAYSHNVKGIFKIQETRRAFILENMITRKMDTFSGIYDLRDCLSDVLFKPNDVIHVIRMDNEIFLKGISDNRMNPIFQTNPSIEEIVAFLEKELKAPISYMTI